MAKEYITKAHYPWLTDTGSESMEESIEDQELRVKLIAEINESLDVISKNLKELQE